MARQIAFTEQAIADMNDIADYISADSEHYAQLQLEKIFRRTDILEQYPQVGRIVPEVNQKSIREIIEGNYRIIYRVVNKELIHIVTVHHSRQLLKAKELKTIIKRAR